MANIAFFHNARYPYDENDLGTGKIKGIESSVLQWSAALRQQGHVVNLYLEKKPLPPQQFDIAIAINEADLLWNVAAKKKFLWLHNILPLEKAIRKRRLLPQLWMKMPVIVSSQWHANNLSPLLRMHGVHIMPLGINDCFQYIARETAPPPNVAYITHLYRGFDHFYDMWLSTILPAVPQAKLHVYGEIKQRHDSIITHTPVGWSQLSQELATMRCTVFPWDRPETFCLAAAESLATGTPVVTYSIGAIPEHNGTIIVQDAKYFSKKVIDLLQNDTAWLNTHQKLRDIDINRWGNVFHL